MKMQTALSNRSKLMLARQRAFVIAVSLCLVGEVGYSEIGQILSLQRNKNHTFSVVCENSTYDDVTADDLKNDRVCNPDQLEPGLYRIRDGSDRWYCTEHKILPEFDDDGNLLAIQLELAGNCAAGSKTRLLCDDTLCKGPNPTGATGGERSVFDIKSKTYTYKAAEHNQAVEFTKLANNKSLAIIKGDFKIMASEAK